MFLTWFEMYAHAYSVTFRVRLLLYVSFVDPRFTETGTVTTEVASEFLIENTCDTSAANALLPLT